MKLNKLRNFFLILLVFTGLLYGTWYGIGVWLGHTIQERHKIAKSQNLLTLNSISKFFLPQELPSRLTFSGFPFFWDFTVRHTPPPMALNMPKAVVAVVNKFLHNHVVTTLSMTWTALMGLAPADLSSTMHAQMTKDVEAISIQKASINLFENLKNFLPLKSSSIIKVRGQKVAEFYGMLSKANTTSQKAILCEIHGKTSDKLIADDLKAFFTAVFDKTEDKTFSSFVEGIVEKALPLQIKATGLYSYPLTCQDSTLFGRNDSYAGCFPAKKELSLKILFQGKPLTVNIKGLMSDNANQTEGALPQGDSSLAEASSSWVVEQTVSLNRDEIFTLLDTFGLGFFKIVFSTIPFFKEKDIELKIVASQQRLTVNGQDLDNVSSLFKDVDSLKLLFQMFFPARL